MAGGEATGLGRVLAPYRAILALPGTLRFAAAGLLARAEIGMEALGTVLLVQSTTGSYAIGGTAAAVLGGTSAVGSLLLARVVDRVGQGRVIRVAVPVHAVLLIALVAVAETRGPLALLLASAAAAGLTQVSMGSLVRSRWASRLAGTPPLQTAFALESVLDEVVFIVGPVAVTLLAALVSPALGPLLAAATALAGGLLLAAQRDSEPPVTGPAVRVAGPRPRPIPALRGMPVVLLVFLGLGGVFGASEVAVAASTKAAGVPALAGLTLGLWAVGSLIAGTLYGAIAWRSRLGPRFAALAALFAASVVPMILVPVPVLPVVFLIAGVTNAPVITAGFALTEALVPPARLTEGFAWTNTAISLTYALSAALAGVVIDGFDARTGFLVPLVSGLLGALVVLVGLRTLRPAPLQRPA